MEKTRVLFVAEAVHPGRPGWMLTLARALDPDRFQPFLASRLPLTEIFRAAPEGPP